MVQCKESTCQSRRNKRPRFNPWVRKILWSRKRILGSGKFPGVEKGNTLQHSCLENYMDRGAWQATVHGGLKELYTTKHTQAIKQTFHSLFHIYFNHCRSKTDNKYGLLQRDFFPRCTKILTLSIFRMESIYALLSQDSLSRGIYSL